MSLVGEMAAGEMAAGADSLERVERGVEDCEEMDARVAAIIHLQQLQNKQEVMQLLEAHAVTNADTEFRMQLEELVRDHLNTCMALASCSSNAHDSTPLSPPFRLRRDSSGNHHMLDRCTDEECHHDHEYRGLVDKEEGGGNDERDRLIGQQPSETSDASSVLRRFLTPQTGVAGRWDERQGSEPTPREREVREAELLALSSLQTVSTLDASFLQGSPSPRTETVERPQRLSSLFRMWKELEGERGEMERNHPPESVPRTAHPDETSVQAAEAQSEVVEDMSNEIEGRANDTIDPFESAEVRNHEQIEPEMQESNNVNSPGQEPSVTRNEMQESDGERERVRLLVRRWMRDSGVGENEASANGRASGRVEWLGEDERERVRRMTREWMRASERPGESPAVQSHEPQIGQEVPSPGSSIQALRRRFGGNAERREMILELLVRSEQERQREIASILEHRTVSEFAHRNRLQSFLRGRFLRNGGSIDATTPPSSASGEIGQLRQRRAVSGLREGFRFRLETIVRSQSGTGPNDGQIRQGDTSVTNSEDRVTNPEERVTNSERVSNPGRLTSFEGRLSNFEERGTNSADRGTNSEERFRNSEARVTYSEESVTNSEYRATNSEQRVTNLEQRVTNSEQRVTNSEARVVNSEDRVTNPEEGVTDSEERLDRHVNRWATVDETEGQNRVGNRGAQWTHELQSLEDATAYNMELRELLARQSVTTMLASEFRERLDALIRSFMHTQGRSPRPWNVSRSRQTERASQQEQGPQQGQVQEEGRSNGTRVPPPPPLPPPMWQESLQQSLQESLQRSIPQRAPPPRHLFFDHERMVMHQTAPSAWTRPPAHRSGELEWETTSRALRGDVTILQRSMNELREMMEASIQMQSELQRSIRQEISGALQRMYMGKEIPPEALDGSRWTSVKKGTCCICCDKQVDCLLYRCGHMCTCVKCAKELHKNNGRCPMCRASIVEVVRAFTVT